MWSLERFFIDNIGSICQFIQVSPTPADRPDSYTQWVGGSNRKWSSLTVTDRTTDHHTLLILREWDKCDINQVTSLQLFLRLDINIHLNTRTLYHLSTVSHVIKPLSCLSVCPQVSPGPAAVWTSWLVIPIVRVCSVNMNCNNWYELLVDHFCILTCHSSSRCLCVCAGWSEVSCTHCTCV